MYNRKYVGIVGILGGIGLLLAFTFMWGCSSNSSGSTIIQGDLNDPQFVQIKDNLDSTVDSILSYAFNPLTRYLYLPQDTSSYTEDDEWWLTPIGDEDSVDYQYTDEGWHVTYVANLSASGSVIYYDSLAFFYDSQARFAYKTYIDEIKYRGFYEFEDEADGEIVTLGFTSRVNVSDVSTLTALAIGSLDLLQAVEYEEGGVNIIEEFEVNAIFTDLEFTRQGEVGWQDYETANGSVSADLVANVYNDEVLTTTSEWIIEVTIEDNAATINVTNDNTRWTYELYI